MGAHRAGGPADDGEQIRDAQGGGDVQQPGRGGFQQVRSRGGQPRVEIVPHDQDYAHRALRADQRHQLLLHCGQPPVRCLAAGVRVRGAGLCVGAAGVRGGEEFLELVDDHDQAPARRLGGQPALHRGLDALGRGSGQAGLFQLGQQILPRAGQQRQPPVATWKPAVREGGQEAGLDQRRLAGTRGPQQQQHPLLSAKRRQHLFHGGIASVKPPDVIRGERLQTAVRADLMLHQLRQDLTHNLSGCGVGDSQTLEVGVGSGDSGDHADHQAGDLVDDRSATEPRCQIIGIGQLQDDARTAAGRKQITGHAVTEMATDRRLGRKPEGTNPVPTASHRGPQLHRPGTCRSALQAQDGDVFGVRLAPRRGQYVPHDARRVR